MDYSVLSDFINHPGFELYNMVINAQIEAFRNSCSTMNGVNPLTGKRYTEVEYEVMRYMINNLTEIQNAPLEELRKQIYELEIPEQEIIEKEIELTQIRMAKQKKRPSKKSVCKTKHTAAKA